MRSREKQRQQILTELQRLREQYPSEYAKRSARLLARLEKLNNNRARYALT